MDLKQMKTKVLTEAGKHKYALVILALGLVLMLLPSGERESREQVTQTQQTTVQEQDAQQALEKLLSQVEGAGKVQVLLTYAAGPLTVYQEDGDITEGSNSSTRYETVIIRGSDGSETGLVQQVIPAKYLGAVILCQGADKPKVKLAVVEAVSKATGLGADQISVLKMK